MRDDQLLFITRTFLVVQHSRTELCPDSRSQRRRCRPTSPQPRLPTRIDSSSLQADSPSFMRNRHCWLCARFRLLLSQQKRGLAYGKMYSQCYKLSRFDFDGYSVRSLVTVLFRLGRCDGRLSLVHRELMQITRIPFR
jgi:hypothetical protein